MGSDVSSLHDVRDSLGNPAMSQCSLHRLPGKVQLVQCDDVMDIFTYLRIFHHRE